MFDLKKFLIENQLTRNSQLLTEVSIEMLKTQYVDGGKLEQEVFDKVVEASANKSAYVTWLAKKVATKVIKDEDVYKFNGYFQVFDKNKKLFSKPDINQYKTSQDVNEFTSKAQEIRDREAEITGGDDSSSDGLVTPNEVRKLEAVGIKLLGLQDGYQVFKVPQSLSGNEQAWKVYKNILGRCGGRAQGDGIDICTMADSSYFDEYLEDGPYYVIFNLNDKQSPYQFHYESAQFMDRNDSTVA